LIEPKGLFLALKEQVRRRILETFAWSDGSFQLLEPEEMKKEVQPMRSDPLALIREGLLNHWTPDRLLADLTPYIELFPNRTPAFEEAERLLGVDEETSSLLDRIDGTRNLGETIGSGFNSSQILATIWILTQGRLIHFDETAIDRAEGQEAEKAEESDDELFTTEIEIEIATAGGTESASAANRSILTTESRVESGGVTKQAMEMRAEVLDLLPGLGKRSFYDLLGIDERALDSEIRKAYFTKAKRFHPDALTHLGLGDIKDAAAQVFARIAEANNVLRDPRKRANYDARGDSEEIMVDTRALAQAETAYRKGEILIRMGDFRGALEYLEPAVELWPDECEYQSALGWALYKQPKPDAERALVHLEKAVELGSSDATALHRLGTVLRASGDGERRATFLTQAKMIDPDIG